MYRLIRASAASRPLLGRFSAPLLGRFSAASRPLLGRFSAASRPLLGRFSAACYITRSVMATMAESCKVI
jgi:hypothetical protein